MTSWSMTDAVRSWNWSGCEGKPVTVEVYTDAEEAALYVNGALVERREVGLEKKARVLFETVYTPGVLETVVYKEGKETGRDRIETAGSAGPDYGCRGYPADSCGRQRYCLCGNQHDG